MPTRVLIVDDHDVLADSLAHVVNAERDLEVVGIAGSLRAAEDLVRTTAPDVLLLDHSLPDGDGVAAIPSLRALLPGVRIVVLTANASEHVLVAAVEHGATGFVAKTRSLSEVTSAVRAAAAGEAVVTPEILSTVLPRLHPGGRPVTEELTAREREVLTLVAEGLTNAAIAQRLSLSVHTVRNHISHLCTKLDAHSKLEALSVAMRQGLLPRP
ncbi:MAG: response regulator transcription factor [Marmoricola sp.]|nr:response regulator transcription factor [Marmoricola sp.]